MAGRHVSLVDAFRRGDRSPVEELEATLAAIDASALNAWSYRDDEAARAEAERADVSLPFGGVPIGVKELDHVAGWPYTQASVPLADECRASTRPRSHGSEAAGAVLVGMTTASEFGGVNLTRTVLNGITANPWHHDRTPGGSSGGTAAAVAGGHVTLGTAGDGGGSIRIPAGFTGTLGLKVTFGRIPPRSTHRDRDPSPPFPAASPARCATPPDGSTCATATTRATRSASHASKAGKPASARPSKTSATCASRSFPRSPMPWCPGRRRRCRRDGRVARTRGLGVEDVDVDVRIPSMGTAWALAGLIAEFAALGDRWPACEDQLTPEIRYGLRFSRTAATGLNRAHPPRATPHRTLRSPVAAIFDAVDLVVTAANPDVAFAATGPLPDTFGGIASDAGNNGRLTIPSNIYGNPAISVPAGTVGGLPVGVQILAPHHQEARLLDAALVVERERPWPLVAPGAAL